MAFHIPILNTSPNNVMPSHFPAKATETLDMP